MIPTLKHLHLTASAAALVAAALTAVSCAEEGLPSAQSEAVGVAMSFTPTVAWIQGHTRRVTTIENNDDLEKGAMKDFEVWAFKADDEAVSGAGVMDGIQIKWFSKDGSEPNVRYGTNDYGYWAYANKQEETMWPQDGTQNVQFYALCPSLTSDIAGWKYDEGTISASMMKASPAFTYTAEDTEGHTGHRDIMVAGRNVYLRDVNKYDGLSVNSTKQMQVDLDFQHVLSLIDFDGQILQGYPNLKVVVYEIGLCGISQSGTCTLASDGTPTWEPAEKELNTAAYIVKTGGESGLTLENDENGNSDYNETGEERLPLSNGTVAGNGEAGEEEILNHDQLTLIPQTITPWVPTENPATAPSGAYLRIRCKITQNGFDLLMPETDGNTYIYAPLPNDGGETGWKPGKKYTYHLVFGLGRNKDGQLNGVDIKIAVSAATWETISHNT